MQLCRPTKIIDNIKIIPTGIRTSSKKVAPMPGTTMPPGAQAKFDDNKAYVAQEEEGQSFVRTSCLIIVSLLIQGSSLMMAEK